jgi:hypothetical protein
MRPALPGGQVDSSVATLLGTFLRQVRSTAIPLTLRARVAAAVRHQRTEVQRCYREQQRIKHAEGSDARCASDQLRYLPAVRSERLVLQLGRCPSSRLVQVGTY